MARTISKQFSEMSELLEISEAEVAFLLLSGYIPAFPNAIGRDMSNLYDWWVEKSVLEKVRKFPLPEKNNGYPMILHFSAETIGVVVQSNLERNRSYTLSIMCAKCDDMGYIDAQNFQDVRMVLSSKFITEHGLLAGRTFLVNLFYQDSGQFLLRQLHELV